MRRGSEVLSGRARSPTYAKAGCGREAMSRMTCAACCVLLLAVEGCGAAQEPSRERGSAGADGGSKESGGRAREDGAPDAIEPGTSDSAVTSTPGQRLAREAELWKAFEINGDWSEFQPTLAELAASADGVVVASLTEVSLGAPVQGDTEEDVVSEAQLRAVVTEMLQGAVDTKTVDFTLIIPNVRNHAQAQVLVDKIMPILPIGPVVLILREREPGLYRPVNGYGLWAETSRRSVDAPLNPEPPQDGVYGSALASITSIAGLVDALRPE